MSKQLLIISESLKLSIDSHLYISKTLKAVSELQVDFKMVFSSPSMDKNTVI